MNQSASLQKEELVAKGLTRGKSFGEKCAGARDPFMSSRAGVDTVVEAVILTLEELAEGHNLPAEQGGLLMGTAIGFLKSQGPNPVSEEGYRRIIQSVLPRLADVKTPAPLSPKTTFAHFYLNFVIRKQQPKRASFGMEPPKEGSVYDQSKVN